MGTTSKGSGSVRGALLPRGGKGHVGSIPRRHRREAVSLLLTFFLILLHHTIFGQEVIVFPHMHLAGCAVYVFKQVAIQITVIDVSSGGGVPAKPLEEFIARFCLGNEIITAGWSVYNSYYISRRG